MDMVIHRTAQAFKALAKELERDHPGAAGSLREGLVETLTVHRLGLPGLFGEHQRHGIHQ